MDASIKGCLNNFNKAAPCIEHKGKIIPKKQLKQILEYGLFLGYERISEFSDELLDKLLTNKTK